MRPPRLVFRYCAIAIICCAAIVFFPAGLYAETEPNNDSSTASPLSINSSSSGTLGSTDVVDWWVITTPSDGKLYVETNSDAALEIDDYMYEIANGHLSLLASYDIGWGTKESTHRDDLKAGTYYIKASRYDGAGAYAISCIFTPTSLANDQEPNDSFVNAQALDTNASATGHLGFYGGGEADPEDWWKTTVYADGKLSFSTLSDSTLEIDLYLFDRDGETQIASYDTGWGIHEQTHFNNLTPGTYFVKAYRYSGYGSYTITSSFTPSRLPNDVEPNDSVINALVLVPNGSSTGHIGYYRDGMTDDCDWWKITIPSDGALLVQTISDSTAEIDLKLFDEDKTTQIASYDISWGIKETTHRNDLMAGTYYVKVINYSGYGSYTISSLYTPLAAANDVEPNDSFAIAKPLAVEKIAMGHLGYYKNGFTDSWDYYAISLSTAWDTLFVRTVSDPTAELDLKLLNASATEIQSSGAWGTRELLIQPSIAAGTYVIGVKRYSGYGAYSILVTSTRPDTGEIPTKARPRDPRAALAKPAIFSLQQSIPFPARGSTLIPYSIAIPALTRLQIFDVTGRKICSLVNGPLDEGYYRALFDATRFAAGIYYCRLESGQSVKTERMIVR